MAFFTSLLGHGEMFSLSSMVTVLIADDERRVPHDVTVSRHDSLQVLAQDRLCILHNMFQLDSLKTTLPVMSSRVRHGYIGFNSKS